MIAEATTRGIESIEELTLFSLDQSQEGLGALIHETEQCAALLSGHVSVDDITRLTSFMNGLHDLNVFEQDVCSLFGIDRELTRDRNGNLRSAADRFRSALQQFNGHMAQHDFAGATELLTGDIRESLVRLRELFPILRSYISKEYPADVKQPSSAPSRPR